jgi:phosphoribosyl 1,2-cyclic phosphodiesterase
VENRGGAWVPDDDHLTVCVLASGSKGNAIYVSDGATALLIDSGISCRELEGRLQSRGLSAETLDAVIVTHEHSDHIRGVSVLSRKYGIPVYMSPGTQTGAGNQIGNLHRTVLFQCGSTFKIKSLAIHPFSISHDAEDPAGITIQHKGRKVGIATDLGVCTAMVKEHLKNCGLLVLEANHDPAMLIDGPYPWFLKQRIKGRTGHLSNEDSKHLLKDICHDNLSHVVLAHLSEVNNSPEIALRVVGEALALSKTRLCVACQDHCGEIICLK